MNDSTILEVKDLSVAFGPSSNRTVVVNRVSFDVRKGETLALVGESGSGKSVSALSILQLLPYPTASHPSGSITYQGQELVGANEEQLLKLRGDRIAMIFQEPMTSLNPLHSIEKQVSEILLIHKKLSRRAARERTLELLNRVALPNAEKRLDAFPHELSGGQRQRVMIAMALANDPDILIADEPTTAIDVTIQAQILKLLKKLQEETGMAMILITHDLGIVRKVADRVCVMEKGKIVEANPTEVLFSSPQHEYTKKLLDSEPTGSAAPQSPDSPMVLKVGNLKIWFPIKKGILKRTVDYVKAVDGISLQIKQGHTVGVVGESGSGKTTLAMGLLRLQKSEGELEFNGRSLQNMNRAAMRPLRSEMQIVFQDPYGSLNPRFSIAQIIEEGLRIHNLGDTQQRRQEMIDNVLTEVGLEPSVQDRYPHEFSGGQRQRIAIARAIIVQPKFIVLDEPTSALDMSVQAQIIDLLRDLQKRHKLAYLFISHDLKVVRAMADEVVVMQAGKVVEQGLAKDIFDNPQKKYTKALMTAAFDIDVIEDSPV